jgi:putative ATP-dependent endonuclease of the OLD family
MILQKAIILNYQSCRKVEIELQLEAPTILIGINDSGKSTILRALGLLLNPTASFSFQKDISAKRDLSNTTLQQQQFDELFMKNSLPTISYSGQETCILGRFVIEQGDFDVSLTTELSNHLLWSIEKSIDSSIWLAKVFSGVTFTQDLYLLTNDVDTQKTELQELWSKKSTELKSLRSKSGVTNDEIENVNKVGRFTNLEQIRPLYSKETLKPQWRKYSDFKKDIDYFPQYRYLGWDFTLDDLKKIANDVMKTTIDKYTNSVRQQANAVASTAEAEVNKLLSSYVGLLQEDAPTLTGLKTHMFYDVKPVISDILINKMNADRDIHLDSQGEGIKRQIWFGLIRIASKQAIQSNLIERRQFIWCFDEPETHLYPAAQRKFFDALKNLSCSAFQVLLSTHSTVFTDRTKIEHINNTILVDGYTTVGTCLNVDDIFSALQLRNSDFLFYDKFLIVEGDTEKYLLPHIYELINNRSLIQDGIQLITLGSKDKRDENIKAIRNVLSDFRKFENQITMILDGDARQEKLSTKDLKVHYFGKQDIEDLIAPKTWMNVLKQIGLGDLITEERMKSLQDGIPEGNIQQNQKFFELLRNELYKSGNEVSKQLVIANYPKKGEDLGKYLKRAIVAEEDIPRSIVDVLKVL